MPTGWKPWLWAITTLPERRKRRTAWRISSAAAGVMPPSGRRISSALTRLSVSAWARVSTICSVDSPPLPKAAKGLVGVWSVIPSRRSSSSTVWDGVGSLVDAELTATVIRIKGTTTRKRNRPGEDAEHGQEELLHGAGRGPEGGPGSGLILTIGRQALPSNERPVTREPRRSIGWCGATRLIDGARSNPYMSGLRAGAIAPRHIRTALPMLVTLMKAKLHRATVTQADLDYEGVDRHRRRPAGTPQASFRTNRSMC